MPSESKASTRRGGARPGAGRKVTNALGKSTSKSITLPAELWDKLGDKPSQAIANLLAAAPVKVQR